MSFMFNNNLNFNQVSIRQWIVNNGTNLRMMFFNGSDFMNNLSQEIIDEFFDLTQPLYTPFYTFFNQEPPKPPYKCVCPIKGLPLLFNSSYNIKQISSKSFRGQLLRYNKNFR
jgi:hypothetical protein